MLESLLQNDRELLLYLNNLGSEQWDGFWLAITNQFHWIPLFAFIFYLSIKSFGWKKGLFLILSMILLVALSDQFTNLIKNTIQRLRPSSDPSIKDSLRNLIKPGGYSFFSGHSATSTFFSVFVILVFKERYKQVYLMLLFPLFFAYSRLYLGVHYPIDVVSGIIVGVILANVYFIGYKKASSKLFS